MGLIGLKSAYPSGIDWSKLRGVGELVKSRAEARLDNVDNAIDRADRRASALFSLVVFTATGALVMGTWLLAVFIVAILFGPALGGSNAFVEMASPILAVVIVSTPILLWLLDGIIAKAIPRMRDFKWFRALIAFLFFVERLFFPIRFMGLSRYTLQSNTLPRLFFPLFVFLLIMAIWLSTRYFQAQSQFDRFDNHKYLRGVAASAGHYSYNYESQIINTDRFRFLGPVIPAPVIETAWLPLFLPYQPIIDNPVLERRCPENALEDLSSYRAATSESEEAANARDMRADELATSTRICLSKLWLVELDGVEQSLEGFVASQRNDLGLRGLNGYLPLNGLEAGPHQLVIYWRPSPEQDNLDNDLSPPRWRHVIPFIWSPGIAAKPKPVAQSEDLE